MRLLLVIQCHRAGKIRLNFSWSFNVNATQFEKQHKPFNIRAKQVHKTQLWLWLRLQVECYIVMHSKMNIDI